MMTEKGPRTVLLVDDSGFMVEILQLTLKQRLNPHDYLFISAKDGVSALEIIDAQKPDIVIVDIMMPRMDGLTLCKELKTNPKYGKLKLAILTALNTPNEKRRAKDMGIDDYFVKSGDPMEMVRHVQDFIERA